MPWTIGNLRETIAKAFAGKRPPFCFGCGYDLRGVDADRCPECGTAFKGFTEPGRVGPVRSGKPRL